MNRGYADLHALDSRPRLAHVGPSAKGMQIIKKAWDPPPLACSREYREKKMIGLRPHQYSMQQGIY
jgi:hypothetical protein